MSFDQKGLFITLEGIEGAGKSTAMRYIQQWLVAANIPHVLTREPGGTVIAEAIRQLLLGHYPQETMVADTELMLMFASRAQHLHNLILPALNQGKWVVCDRFTDATYAYQGGGRGINMTRISQIEQWVQGDLRPDQVLLLDLPVELGMQRIRRRANSDRIESETMGFFARVRQAYLARASNNAAYYTVIDASQSKRKVQMAIEARLASLKR